MKKKHYIAFYLVIKKKKKEEKMVTVWKKAGGVPVSVAGAQLQQMQIFNSTAHII